MRALFLLITVLCAGAYSINPFTYPWIIRLTGDTATVAKWKGNNDTVQVWAGRMSDTTNKISREIDSIRAGKVAHDSMTVTGNLRAATYNDSITAAEFAHINGLTGNVQAAINRRLYGTITAGRLALKSGDTLKTSIIADDGTTATVNGVFKAQGSSFAIATSAVGNTLEFLRDGVNYITALAGTASAMIIDGYSDVRFRVNGVDKLNVSSTVTKVYDNLINRSGNTSRGLSFEADDDGVFSDTVKARVGTFSGVVRADSLRTPKGISGVNARFTSFIGSLIGNVTGNVTGSISGGTVAGSTGTFSGNVIVDSLKSTKGISGVNARFTSFIGNVTGNVSGYSNTGNNTNVSSGFMALSSITSGVSNTAYGYNALILNTTGSHNVAIGDSALAGADANIGDVAIGWNALKKSTISGSTAIGNRALTNSTTGDDNTAIGALAAYTNTTGSFMVAFGYQSLCASTTGNSNTAIGFRSLYANTTGSGNTAVGDSAGISGNYSNTTVIGYKAVATKDNELAFPITQVVNYADSAAAYAAGVRSGGVYRVGGSLMIMY